MPELIPPTGGYVAYREMRSPKIGAGLARVYWHGPGSHRWGTDARDTAARFGDQHAARAALVVDGEVAGDVLADPGGVGYEWVAAAVEQLALPLGEVAS